MTIFVSCPGKIETSLGFQFNSCFFCSASDEGKLRGAVNQSLRALESEMIDEARRVDLAKVCLKLRFYDRDNEQVF